MTRELAFHRAASAPRLWPAALFTLLQTLSLIASSKALAQAVPTAPDRRAVLTWDGPRQRVYGNFDFQDVIDAEVTRKLQLGLPARILLTALVFRRGSTNPIASTFQSCKVTWHVWEDMYRVELLGPETPAGTKQWTPTLAGVLRRCATASRLLVASSAQVGSAALSLDVTVRINPLGEELLNQLRRWISDTPQNLAADPSSAVFSTFTGLFLQRLGDAEKTLRFRTIEAIPQ